jgi:FkbM family methyltransferase
MTNYWDERFLNFLNKENIKYICEVGARYGDESIQLSKVFNNANIISFECNPNTVNICYNNLKNHDRIKFFNLGLGHYDDKLPFYSYKLNNDGASSFYKRIDFEETQVLSGYVTIRPLSSVLCEEKIPYLDLLCMDVQGYELNILKGCKEFLEKINYIIMEEPKEIINTVYLPEGIHSKYVNAPKSNEIKEFMNKHNFIEIARISENYIEDNVMYKKI